MTGIILAGIIAVAGIVFLLMSNDEPGKDKDVKSAEIKTTAEEGTYVEIEEDRKESVEEEIPDNLTENVIQDMIHYMSHQKVEAEEKWG